MTTVGVCGCLRARAARHAPAAVGAGATRGGRVQALRRRALRGYGGPHGVLRGCALERQARQGGQQPPAAHARQLGVTRRCRLRRRPYCRAQERVRSTSQVQKGPAQFFCCCNCAKAKKPLQCAPAPGLQHPAAHAADFTLFSFFARKSLAAAAFPRLLRPGRPSPLNHPPRRPASAPL